MEELGWETLLAVDHDAKACQVYRANIPAREVRCGDLVPMLGTLPAADVIVGGPPCQPFSHAGKREGAEDARDCVPDFIAAAAKGRPRMFLMEQVQGFTTIEDGRYMQRAVRAMEAAGYAVQMRLLDAVSYGVPQFRLRAWFWGIRRDLHASGAVRHRWPSPTHVWPWPDQACMFGGDLRPAVTTGQALGLDAGIIHRRTANPDSPQHYATAEPAGTQLAQKAQDQVYEPFALRRARGASVERRDHPAAEPAPTLADGSGGSGGIFRLVGGGRNHPKGEDGTYRRDKRDLTDEPATTIADLNGSATPSLYRWSEAMYDKHPPASPASPASPAPTVQAKWFKGGAEGLLSVIGGRREGGPGKAVAERDLTDEPAQVIGDLSHGHRNGKPRIGIIQNGPEKGRHIQYDKQMVRRLTPAECARLQSLPDDFLWPDSVAKTHRYRIIGNGWASLMALHMSRALRAADPGSRTLIDLFCGGGCGAVGWHGRAWEYEPAAGLVTAGLEPAPCR